MVSLNTKFSSIQINTQTNLEEFLVQVQFPSHGIIVRRNENDLSHIEKVIHDKNKLKEVIQQFLQSYGTCFLETDMRAMHNPTRMKVIEEVTEKLIVKMKQSCPKCQAPGFSVTDVVRGLICSDCFRPTQSINSLIYSCQKCHFTHLETNPDNKIMEDPKYCDFCNP